MKRGFVLPFAILVACWAGLVALVLWGKSLPSRMATHFAANGQPNGWMTSSTHVAYVLGFGIGVSVFVLATFALIRMLGGKALNVPNRDYWLSPERREETLDFVLRHGVWLACLLVVFFGAVHLLILDANERQPAGLSNNLLIVVVGGFLVSVVYWSARLILHFRLPK